MKKDKLNRKRLIIFVTAMVIAAVKYVVLEIYFK